MPNRYLRESLKESEAVNAVSFQAEVVWMRLVVTVDDWGRCEASAKLLRPKLFPLRLDQVREAELQRWIAECEIAGLLRLFQSEGKEYLQMMKWELGRAATSKHPAPTADVLECCYLQAPAYIRKRLQTAANNGKQMFTAAPDSDSEEREEKKGKERRRSRGRILPAAVSNSNRGGPSIGGQP